MPDSTVALAAAKVASPKFVEEDDDNEIDAEIVEVFIEEAGEVRETLDEQFPLWKQNFQDQDSLTVVRRAFHTLKGSGRMVKANDIGELAWAVENMLNRVIDKTVPAAPHHAHLIERVLDILPSMIDAFAKRQANPKPDETQQYMAWGEALASGELPEALVSVKAAAEPAPVQVEVAAEVQKPAESQDVPAEAAKEAPSEVPTTAPPPVAGEQQELNQTAKQSSQETIDDKPVVEFNDFEKAAEQSSKRKAPVKEPQPASTKVERLKPKPKLKSVPTPPAQGTSQGQAAEKKPAARAAKAHQQRKSQSAQSLARMNAESPSSPDSSRWSMLWAVVLLVAMIAIFGLILF